MKKKKTKTNGTITIVVRLWAKHLMTVDTILTHLHKDSIGKWVYHKTNLTFEPHFKSCKQLAFISYFLISDCRYWWRSSPNENELPQSSVFHWWYVGSSNAIFSNCTVIQMDIFLLGTGINVNQLLHMKILTNHKVPKFKIRMLEHPSSIICDRKNLNPFGDYEFL